MTLLAAFVPLTAEWRSVFAQERTLLRERRQAPGALLVLGRATLSRILRTNGREQRSWPGEYFLHARAKWEPQALFAPLLKGGLSFCPGRLAGVAVDDTEVAPALWQSGARTRSLRLFVLAPAPYRKRKSGRFYYRQPAYLLTTGLTNSPRQLLQIYFDRRRIEVNHREEKDALGAGQAQLWNPTAVPKQPAGGCRLQRAPACLSPDVWRRARQRLRLLAEMAAQRQTAFVFGSHHAAAKRGRRTS